MARFARNLIALLFALAVALGVGPAGAQELRAAPTSDEVAVLRGGAAPQQSAPPPALVQPGDVPVLVTGAAPSIPSVPPAWLTRDLGWLKLSYPTAAAERVQSLERDAEGIKSSLADVLGQRVLEHVEVRVVPTVGDMERLAPVGAPPPAYASGVAYPRLHLVLLSMLAPRGGEAVDLDEVFRHELAHVALEDAVGGQHVPVWFNEGIAIYTSDELAAARLQVLWSSTLSGTLLPLADLDRRFPSDHFEVNIAYAESASFTRFLMRKTDRVRFASMIERVREGQSFDRALADAYGSDLRKLEFQWRSDIEKRYSVVPILAGGGLVWGVVIAALVAAYVRKRRRAKAILARWEREEALEDAIRARRAAEAIDAARLLRVPVSLRLRAKVEHEGGWHTLH